MVSVNTDKKGEMFSFDFKFKAPSDLIKKVSTEIEYKGKGMTSGRCGIPNYTTENIKEKTGTGIDEDRLESHTWPWIASLYIDEKYRCTVNMVTRSEGLTASNCLDSHLDSSTMRIETYNNKSKSYFRVKF